MVCREALSSGYPCNSDTEKSGRMRVGANYGNVFELDCCRDCPAAMPLYSSELGSPAPEGVSIGALSKPQLRLLPYTMQPILKQEKSSRRCHYLQQRSVDASSQLVTLHSDRWAPAIAGFLASLHSCSMMVRCVQTLSDHTFSAVIVYASGKC